MSHAGGQIGKGIRAAYSAESPVSWVKIPAVLDATVPSFQADDIDITTHDTSGKLKKSIAGLVAVGDVTLTCLGDFKQGDVAAYSALTNANRLGTILWFRLEIPADTTLTLFKVYEYLVTVKTASDRSPIAGRQEVEFVLKFSGDDIGIYYDQSSAIS